MNYRFVLNQLSLLISILGGILVALAGLSWLFLDDHSGARLTLLISGGGILAVAGITILFTRRGQKHLGRREALLLVAMSWIIGAGFAAVPYFLWAQVFIDQPHPFAHFENCYFESMSGLTTTGATILTGDGSFSDIEQLPPSLLLWRSITHWLGGLGIVVLFVAVLPSLGVGARRLFQVEAPGPAPEGLQPQIRETARVLWYIYTGLTAVEIVVLHIAGMPWFDSICHTFGTLATGGFSTQNASIGGYGRAVQIIIILFMVIAGTNFGLYYHLIRGHTRTIMKDVELRVYFALLAVGSIVIYFAILNTPVISTTGAEDVLPMTRTSAAAEAIFTTVSIQTTTGYCTSDFNGWPFVAHAMLIMLMFVGGCSGSTSGGIKVIRVWVAFKVMISEIEHVFRPNVVRPLRVGGGTIDPEMKLSAVAYVLGIVILFAVGSCLLMLFEHANPSCTFTTAGSAAIATLCTIGPGFGKVGAVENYLWFTPASKIVLSILMALGRLEVFAIIVLLTPRFWRGDT